MGNKRLNKLNKKQLTMKKLLLITLLSLFVSCGGSGDDCCLSGVMQLTIVNNFDRWTINSIQLQGYDFQNLSISGSDSRTFVLIDGIPTGGLDAGVTIGFSCDFSDDLIADTRVDFYDGQTTKITINPTPDHGGDATLQDCFKYAFSVSNN